MSKPPQAKIPKRHHFVPEMLQKNFADESGRLFYARKVGDDQQVKCGGPGNIFVEQHLYSAIDESNQKDPSLEFWFSALETKVDQIVRRTLCRARSGQNPGLSSEEKSDWNLFFYMQWKRVPDLHLTTTTKEQVEEQLDNILQDLLSAFPNRAAEIEEFKDPAKRRRFIHNARVDTIARRSEKIDALMSSRGVTVLVNTNPKKKFIIGSHPVVKLAHGDLTHPESEMWLPVASDVLIGLGRLNRGEELLQVKDFDAIRRLNLAVSAQSTTIAGASADLIQSLMKPR